MDLVTQTLTYERKRAITSGIIDTASTTFLLLIAVKWFEAGNLTKAIIAAGSSFGFLLSPLAVYFAERSKQTISIIAASLSIVGAIAFLLAAIFPTLPLFVLASSIGVATTSASIPLYTQMYQENYPKELRGSLFSQVVILRILSAGVFSLVVGWAISGRMQYFPVLMLLYAGSMLLGGLFLLRIKTTSLSSTERARLFRGFHFLKTDRVFRQTSICWMLLGFGNLMMIPLRIEYLAHEKYGLLYTAFEVALLVSVIPNIARVLLSGFWGKLFDRMNFFALRAWINLGFMIGVASFFLSDSKMGLVIGSILYGVSNAGGEIAWNLWVTKFAPPNRVASYMSVHVFLTGIRGVIAPIVGFYLVDTVSLATLTGASLLLMLLASGLLIPEYKFEKIREAKLRTKQGA